MPMYNLIEYSDNYQKISRSLWEYYRDEPHAAIVNSELFKSKIKKTGKSLPNGNSKTVEVAVPLYYLSNFWGTLEMPLINCEINLALTLSSTCVITNSTGTGTFAVTDTKLCIAVITLSIQDSANLLQ